MCGRTFIEQSDETGEFAPTPRDFLIDGFIECFAMAAISATRRIVLKRLCDRRPGMPEVALRFLLALWHRVLVVDCAPRTALELLLFLSARICRVDRSAAEHVSDVGQRATTSTRCISSLGLARRLAGCTPRQRELLPLAELAKELGVHVRTLQAAARTGRLETQFSVRSVFGRPMRFASRDAGEQFIARHYRCFSGQEICPAPLPTVPDDYDKRLRDVRRRRGLTQGALARCIGAAGKAVVYQWESRKRTPSPVLWQRVLDLRGLQQRDSGTGYAAAPYGPDIDRQNERTELEARLRSRTIRSEAARRARVILMLANGDSYSSDRSDAAVLPRLHQSVASAIPREAPGGAGVAPLQPAAVGADRRDGSAHSGEDAPSASRRQHALEYAQARALLKINHNHVAKAWQRAGLQPHRFERYMASDDPDFETKAADMIGLYLNPPQHAAVFAVDEKTAIQAWTGSTRCCRCRPAAPNATASSTTATERCRCLPPSIRSRAKCSGRLCPATPARRSSTSSATSSPASRAGARFM